VTGSRGVALSLALVTAGECDMLTESRERECSHGIVESVQYAKRQLVLH
jgi:hypothetical protein